MMKPASNTKKNNDTSITRSSMEDLIRKAYIDGAQLPLRRTLINEATKYSKDVVNNLLITCHE